MSDLISRKRIEFELGESNMPKKYRDFCRRVINSESLSPSIDAVEVVRCRDCKFYRDAFGGHTCDNGFWNDGYVIPTEPNDFCSYGERKEATE